MALKPINRTCPHCGNGNYMRLLEFKNVGKLDVKCINCDSYFNYDELNQKGGKNQMELKLCPFCEAHEDGDRLYEASDWDGGVGYDYVDNIHFCPLCGAKLKTFEEKKKERWKRWSRRDK